MADTDLFADLHHVRGGGGPADPRAAPHEPEPKKPRAREWVLLLAPGVVFVAAGVVLALAVLTVAGGEFAVLPLLGVVPAVGSAFLAVRGKSRRRPVLCGASALVLLVWGGLFALLG